jgi:hypothetical protein
MIDRLKVGYTCRKTQKGSVRTRPNATCEPICLNTLSRPRYIIPAKKEILHDVNLQLILTVWRVTRRTSLNIWRSCPSFYLHPPAMDIVKTLPDSLLVHSIYPIPIYSICIDPPLSSGGCPRPITILRDVQESMC